MAGEAAIETRGLKKSFGSVQALAGIDLDVPAGSVLGLLGPNGAGKTTAVRILTTLLPPDEGEARVAGLDVVRDAGALRAQIGLAGQYAAVDENLTGFENLEMVGRLYHMGARPSRDRANELLERFELTEAAGRLVRTYSGGMRRRSPLEVIAGIGLMLLFGYAFSWVFAYVGLTASSPEAAQSLGFIAIFPLTFASSAFVPPESMPHWLEAFADVNPFTTVVDAMRALWVGGPANNDVWAAVAWSVGLIAVFVPLSVRRYRRAVSA